MKGSSQEEPPRRTLSSIRNDSTFKSSPVATCWNHSAVKSSSGTAGPVFQISPGLRNRCTLVCLLPHYTRHVWELTSYRSRTQCFLFPVDKNWCSPCTSLSPFFYFFAFIPSDLSFSSRSILFSLTLYQSFFLSGSKDVRHSSVWFVLPSPSASLLLPPFLLSSFTEKEGGRRRVEEGGCRGGGGFFLLVFFSVYVALLK